MHPAGAFFLIAVLSFLAALVSGCGGSADVPREDRTPAPSSSLTKQDAIASAQLWAMFDTSRRGFCEVAPTGSMAPVIDSRSVLLLERVRPGDLRPNDIAIFEREPGKPSVCHRVHEVRPDGVLFSGDNNRGSDGWIRPERIQWRVAGILYTQR